MAQIREDGSTELRTLLESKHIQRLDDLIPLFHSVYLHNLDAVRAFQFLPKLLQEMFEPIEENKLKFHGYLAALQVMRAKWNSTLPPWFDPETDQTVSW